MRRLLTIVAIVGATAPLAHAQARAGGPAAPVQMQPDEYTRYELLAPETASFKIVEEISVTSPGARTYLDAIPGGGAATKVAVTDLMTGAPLPFAIVTGADARGAGARSADPAARYLRITLARPVPANGETRVRIEKTYASSRNYHREGDLLVFTRTLSARRNSVVLPSGYALVSCSVPAQVLSEIDGRIKVSFTYQGVGDVPLTVKARTGAPTGQASWPKALTGERSWEKPPAQGPTERQRLDERAYQDREIVYFLKDPETHAFSLYHDYTESRTGIDKYVNVVRGGSKVSNVSAYILDTGEVLRNDVLRGAFITSENIDIGGPVTPDSEAAVVHFPPVKAGQSVRLRISETYTAPESYRLDGNDLVFDRSFGRPRNAVVLPPGWYLTASSVPALVSETADHLTRLDFVNDRNDDIDVLIKARKLVGR